MLICNHFTECKHKLHIIARILLEKYTQNYLIPIHIYIYLCTIYIYIICIYIYIIYIFVQFFE